MKKRYTLAVLIMGFSGLAAQIILLRELLITFFGNELSIGIILANWLILEAAGCLLLGGVIDRVKKPITAFVLASLVFSICLPAMVFLTRIIKEVIGVSAGEGLGILPILYTSFFILLPVSVTHGALFTFSCKITSSDALEKSSSVGRVYIYEIFGTIIGGICLTYIFIPLFNSLQTAFIVALLNITLCLILLGPFWRNAQDLSRRILGILSSILLIIGVFSVFGKTSERLHNYSINRQWKDQNLLHYENSVYGNIAVVERGGEYTFYSSGLPVFTAPNPDTVFIEEFAHLPLLAHPEPKEILVISGGIGGLINEILKHPVERVDYAEIDPLILKVAAKFPSEITESELSDPRTNIYNADGRLLVRETARKYDLVYVGLSNPQDLQTNRLFTKEFFNLVKARLNENAILALNLPGSTTYLSKELKELNSCILNTLQTVFRNVEVIPGDGINLYLSSAGEKPINIIPEEAAFRIKNQNIDAKLITGEYLNYRLDKRWEDWFFNSLKDSQAVINRDFKPAGVFYSLSYWNALFSPNMRNIFAGFSKINIYHFLFPALLLAAAFFFVNRKYSRISHASVPLAIAATGFAGMLLDLILIFMFQVFYGYIFGWIGLLVTAFMAGSAFGGGLVNRFMGRIKKDLAFFMGLDISITVFSLILGIIFLFFMPLLEQNIPPAVLQSGFLGLSFVSGFLVGAQFPLANKIYLKTSKPLSRSVGLLYGCDLLGGWLGGIIGGVILLPVLGVFQACLVLVIIKTASFIILGISSKNYE